MKFATLPRKPWRPSVLRQRSSRYPSRRPSARNRPRSSPAACPHDSRSPAAYPAKSTSDRTAGRYHLPCVLYPRQRFPTGSSGEIHCSATQCTKTFLYLIESSFRNPDPSSRMAPPQSSSSTRTRFWRVFRGPRLRRRRRIRHIRTASGYRSRRNCTKPTARMRLAID